SLMMTGIHLHLRCSKCRGKSRLGSDLHVVGELNCSAGGVIYGRVLDVLHQSSRSPYVQRLQSIADSQNGLVKIVRVLQKELVEIIPAGIGCGGLRVLRSAELLWVNIGGTAGQQHCVTTCDQARNFMRRGA